MAKQLKVIPWTWRNGQIHLEMRLASFHTEAGELVTHLDGPGQRQEQYLGCHDRSLQWHR